MDGSINRQSDMISEIENIKRVLCPIAVKYGVQKVSMFGSRAKNSATESSDYDFLISKGKVDSILSYVSFVNELEEAFGTHVDVVTDTSDDEKIIETARKDGILLYEYKG